MNEDPENMKWSAQSDTSGRITADVDPSSVTVNTCLGDNDTKMEDGDPPNNETESGGDQATASPEEIDAYLRQLAGEVLLNRPLDYCRALVPLATIRNDDAGMFLLRAIGTSLQFRKEISEN